MPATSPVIGDALVARLQEIGATIRGRRKALGISATTTAEAAGISRVTLHRIERGNPSVTIGAYLNAIDALGLDVRLMDPMAVPRPRAAEEPSPMPGRIRVRDYPELRRLAWQRRRDAELTPEETLSMYERNWRHVDVEAMSEDERALVRAVGGGRLLVRA